MCKPVKLFNLRTNCSTYLRTRWNANYFLTWERASSLPLICHCLILMDTLWIIFHFAALQTVLLLSLDFGVKPIKSTVLWWGLTCRLESCKRCLNYPNVLIVIMQKFVPLKMQSTFSSKVHNLSTSWTLIIWICCGRGSKSPRVSLTWNIVASAAYRLILINRHMS